MNPLDQYPAIRQKLYLVQWLVNLVLGALGVVLVALSESPVWFVITSAVFNFVWTYTGLTAQKNTSTDTQDEAEIQADVRDGAYTD